MTSESVEVRRQLSMYVPESVSAELEAVRLLLDPIQHRLIPAHITLCREDELGAEKEPDVLSRLANLPLKPVTLRFGKAEPFFEHGVILHCIDGEAEFHRLRECILGATDIRLLRPHITLAHPRNPKAADNCLSHTARLPEGLSITFDSVRLIEQTRGEPWRVRHVFPLTDGV